jgi:hypothetical protein
MAIDATGDAGHPAARFHDRPALGDFHGPMSGREGLTMTRMALIGEWSPVCFELNESPLLLGQKRACRDRTELL